jgi:hypothetical protein
MAADYGRLEWYLDPTYLARRQVRPHDAVAWRKQRHGRWIAWTYYGRYSWKNIMKWVCRRGDVYQVATASGQLVTIRRRPAPR